MDADDAFRPVLQHDPAQSNLPSDALHILVGDGELTRRFLRDDDRRVVRHGNYVVVQPVLPAELHFFELHDISRQYSFAFRVDQAPEIMPVIPYRARAVQRCGREIPALTPIHALAHVRLDEREHACIQWRKRILLRGHP